MSRESPDARDEKWKSFIEAQEAFKRAKKTRDEALERLKEVVHRTMNDVPCEGICEVHSMTCAYNIGHTEPCRCRVCQGNMFRWAT